MLRVNLYWGGKLGVAKTRPFQASDPRDAAYDWSLYDRTALYAAANGIKLLFSITGTPKWANGGADARTARPQTTRRSATSPTRRRRATAATTSASDGRTLPAVRLWAAWNEPNNPAFLRPQFVRRGSKWVIQSAISYAKICNAVYDGHPRDALQERAGRLRRDRARAGTTTRRARARRSSPIAFLTAAKKAGMKRFDAYAHNPYYGVADRDARRRSRRGRSSGQVADRDHAREHQRADRRGLAPVRAEAASGSPSTATRRSRPTRSSASRGADQARYLTQAFAIARKNPRIDLMLWFLVRDEPNLAGWQSGLMTRRRREEAGLQAFQRHALAPAPQCPCGPAAPGRARPRRRSGGRRA